MLLNRKVPVDGRLLLATDVYLPDGPGRFPTILLRTPYHRSHEVHQGSAVILASRGYGFVVQDPLHDRELRGMAVHVDRRVGFDCDPRRCGEHPFFRLEERLGRPELAEEPIGECMINR